MKTHTSYVAIGLCSLLATLVGCSSDDSTTGTSGTSGSASGTSGTTGTSGTSGSTDMDGSTVDSSMTSTDEASTGDETATAEAASCGSFTTGSATCDQCVQTNCCAAAATCDTADSNGLDDGGFTSCEQLVSCVDDVCSSDAGSNLTDCEMTCNGTYTSDEQMNADALLTCVSTNCMTECM